MSRIVSSLAAMTMIAAVAGGLAGCGPPAPPAGPVHRVFYPSPPDPPRYQFLLSFNDAAAWAGQSKGSFSDFVVGRSATEKPKTKIVNPYGLAARDGKLYVCDLAMLKVHVIDFANNTYGVLGDGRNVVHPLSITIGPDGTRYVCDMALRQVAVFDANDHFIRHLGDPQQCGPSDVAVYGDELYVVDQPGGRIQVWSKNGELKRTISSQGNGPDQLMRPGNVAVGPDGLVYVTDVVGSALKVFDQQGKLVRMIGEAGDTPGNLFRPKGLRIDPSGSVLYVADCTLDTLQMFNLEGQLLLYIREQTDGLPQQMLQPTGLAIDATSVKYFQKYIDSNFQAEYLIFVANEYGRNTIGVYAFGQSKTPMAAPATQPTTQPAWAQPRPAGAADRAGTAPR